MAFNWQTFRIRAATSLVFVAVMLAGLLWNRWSFFLLFSVVHFGAWAEYQKLVSRFAADYKKIIPFHRYGIIIAGWCIMLYFTNDQLHVFNITLSQIGFWVGILFMILLPLIMLLESRHIFLKNIVYSFAGLIYISFPLGLLIALRMRYGIDLKADHLNLEKNIPLALIFSLWINDTMAYIVGSIIGKTPLSKISPNKTWEGTTGGIILCIVVMIFVSQLFSITIIDSVFISAIAAIAGTFGDLFESKLKRMAGIKDSGSIMPGHGGFLDRFDSLLFASVFVWLYAAIFIH